MNSEKLYITKGADLAYIVKDNVVDPLPVIAIVVNSKTERERVVQLTHDLKLDPSAKEPYIVEYDPRLRLETNQLVLVRNIDTQEWVVRHFNATIPPSKEYPNMIYTYPDGRTSFTLSPRTLDHECWSIWKLYNSPPQETFK